jgi:hypothetical protein
MKDFLLHLLSIIIAKLYYTHVMKKILILSFLFLIFLLSISTLNRVDASGLNQQPTIAIPTVTGTPKGITATVPLNQLDSVNVRSGPGALFDKVGVILPGQEVPVLGRSAGGDWVMVEYPGAPNNIGWVYTPLVIISPGELPIIEPPPTVTPAVTQTINATLAAQFITTPNPTRLATFTPAEPLIIPTYVDVSRTSFLGRIPVGIVIIIIGGLGGLMAIFSTVRPR